MVNITLIIGCMFSGKSTELIKKYNEYNEHNDKNILLINHTNDTRYGKNVISSHNKKQLKCFSCLELKEARSHESYKTSNMIMIDEAQFFPDLFDFVIKASETDNKDIIIAGLDGDYKREPFGDILRLIPLSDDIIKLKATCKFCNNTAIFTKRIINNNKQFLIGGTESYVPVCRTHYK